MKIKRIKNNKMKILSGLITWQLGHPGQLVCLHSNAGILANGTVILSCNCACWTNMSFLASYFLQRNFALEQNDPPVNWFFPLKVRGVRGGESLMSLSKNNGIWVLEWSSSAENVSGLQITQRKKIRAPGSKIENSGLQGSRGPFPPLWDPDS